MSDVIKGTRSASIYCKMGHGAFLYHARKGHLHPDFRAGGGTLCFYTETLDTFLARHGNQKDMTIKEIAKRLGKTPGSIKSYVRRYNIPASAMCGTARTFSVESVRLIESLVAGGNQIGVDDGDSA